MEGKNKHVNRRKKVSRSSSRTWSVKWLWVGGLGAILIYVLCLFVLFVSPNSFRWRAFYDEPTYPEGYEVHGIDISHYQGNIEWEKLRNARIKGVPVNFVIIKATEGVSLADEYFQRNFSQARRNEIVRGAYHFFRPEQDARKQARFFIQTAALEPGDLPPILDVEEKGKPQIRNRPQVPFNS